MYVLLSKYNRTLNTIVRFPFHVYTYIPVKRKKHNSSVRHTFHQNETSLIYARRAFKASNKTTRNFTAFLLHQKMDNTTLYVASPTFAMLTKERRAKSTLISCTQHRSASLHVARRSKSIREKKKNVLKHALT